MSDDQMRERLAAARRKMRERDSQWRNDATDVWFSESEADDLWAASVAGVLAADGLVITTQEQAAIGAAVERLPKLAWLGRVPEGWCCLTDNGTDEGEPHIADTPAAAIAAAASPGGTDR